MREVLDTLRTACLNAALYFIFVKFSNAKHSRVMNNCNYFRYQYENAWNIDINAHCNVETVAYKVSDAPIKSINGIYESYGVSGGVSRYERVLNNGTVTKLRREHFDSDRFVWLVSQRDQIHLASFDNGIRPPIEGWLKGDPLIERIVVPRKSIISKHIFDDFEVDQPQLKIQHFSTALDGGVLLESVKDDESIEDNEISDKMLHPAVGKNLGLDLKKTYNSLDPYDAISIDGLLDEDMLTKSLQFLNIPLSKWEGPESAKGCCKNKYRLAFDQWMTNEYAKGLKALAYNQRFIEFVEALSGIDGLAAMNAKDKAFISHGSSLIAIGPGGYLEVHNDFDEFSGLYRRVNVLLYLNKDWDEQWQGHLELWNANVTKCVQRIPPSFNRMVVFTATDDAFHGHPEPLASPPGRLRYGLQLVYYTKQPPSQEERNSNRPGSKRTYSSPHSAVFQPTCTPENKLREICLSIKRPLNDDRYCECNFR